MGSLFPLNESQTPVAFVTSLAISLDDRSNIICLDSRNPVFPDDNDEDGVVHVFCFESSNDPCARWTLCIHYYETNFTCSPQLSTSPTYLTSNIYHTCPASPSHFTLWASGVPQTPFPSCTQIGVFVSTSGLTSITSVPPSCFLLTIRIALRCAARERTTLLPVMEEPNLGPGAASGALRAAPFSSRPPSPPYIHVPIFIGDGADQITVDPSGGGMGSAYLSKDALEIITRGKEQIATNTTTLWSYDNRRAAQKILDFLYLGPASVCRDLDFLRDAGITMILACRDVAFPGGFQSVERAAVSLNITADVLDVDGKYGLPQAFPKAVQKINDHLLSFYRNQAAAGGGAANSSRQGKVLVCCETGNDRSAAIVVAYIMSIFDMGMVKAAQFVGLQRFCCNFDDDVKHALTAYEDIVGAMQDVKAQSDAADKLLSAGTSAEEQWAASTAQIPPQKPGLVGSMEVDLAVSKGTKRRLEETVDSDMADADTVDSGDSDAAGRSFAPFTD